MEFYAVLDHIAALLQQRGRVTYNALKLQFHLDDDQLAVLKDEILYAYRQVVDDAGRGLRWASDMATTQTQAPPAPQHEPHYLLLIHRIKASRESHQSRRVSKCVDILARLLTPEP